MEQLIPSVALANCVAIFVCHERTLALHSENPFYGIQPYNRNLDNWKCRSNSDGVLQKTAVLDFALYTIIIYRQWGKNCQNFPLRWLSKPLIGLLTWSVLFGVTFNLVTRVGLTIILGTLRDAFLEINDLALCSCFSYKNVSKMVSIFCSHFTSIRYKHALRQWILSRSALETVAMNSSEGKFTLKIEFLIGYFIVDDADNESKISPYIAMHYLNHKLVKFVQKCIVLTIQNF